MRKRRYSIDVTTVEGYGSQMATDPLITREFEVRVTLNRPYNDFSSIGNAKSDKEPEVESRYGETEPVLLQNENMPLPNPLRYAPLTRLSHPLYNSETYLSLEESSLENGYFNYILDWEGDEAWMDDSILNVALECLRRSYDCSAHGIDIINTNLVQSIRMFHLTDDTQGPSSDFIRTRLNDKRWIFIPVNDGMNKESYEVNRSGSHWYLIVYDRLHKYAFCYDSQGRDLEHREPLAHEICLSLMRILREDRKQWQWQPQKNSPCQWENNLSPQDKGACGPFVFLMCMRMIERIIQVQRDGMEDQCCLGLTAEFPANWGTFFHSLGVRWQMQNLIAHHRCVQDAARYMEEHDREVEHVSQS